MNPPGLVAVLLCCALIPVVLCASEHSIGVRTRTDGRGEFYVMASGRTFVPRGNNFIRIASQVKLGTGDTTTHHSTFAPGVYDPAAAETALVEMQRAGYNFVRVFITGITTTSVSTLTGINNAYVANVVDFLVRAKSHSLQVLISLDEWLPTAYGRILSNGNNPLAAGVNSYYLSSGGIQAHAAFFSDFVSEMVRQRAPMETVFGYTLRNEQSFDAAQPPMSLTTGTFDAPNGRRYDLSRPDQRLALLQEGLNYFIDQVRAAILAKDQGALVGIGFFAPQEPNSYRIGDTRFVTSAAAITNSSADFIDLHPYPGELSMTQYAQNFGIPSVTRKPLLMGEFGSGAQIGSIGRERAADVLQQWQVDSCAFGFTGWSLWTWDGPPGFWTASPIGGSLDKALSPVFRPDPCILGPAQQLSSTATVTASSTWTGNSPGSGGPQLAIDGSIYTFWNSGGFPPQWIEFQFPRPSIVVGIRLLPSVSTSGQTLHRIYTRPAGGQLTLAAEITGVMQDMQVLTWTAQSPIFGVQSLRVETVMSSEWVAWREIEILSGSLPTISSNGIVNAATFTATPVPAGGSIGSLFGTNLSTATQAAPNVPLPTTLGGTTVSINGIAAPLFYVSPTQVNFQFPWELLGVTQATAVVTVNGVLGVATQVRLSVAGPGIFTMGGGQGAIQIANTSVFAAAPGAIQGAQSRPAHRGEFLTIYCTGLGDVSNRPVNGVGSSASVLSTTVATPSVMIGGVPAVVSFAGLAPGFVGLYQINAEVPNNAPIGNNIPLLVGIQGMSSNTVTIAVQ